MSHLQNPFPRAYTGRRGGLLQSHYRLSNQHGSGFGSFIAGLFRKAVPAVTKLFSKGASVAAKGLKQAAKSEIAKDLGKNLLKSGVEGVADIVAGQEP